jgi:hypothetical protein
LSPREFEHRAAILLGGFGWQQRWASAIGLSRQHVSKVVNGKATLPESWVAILEALERLPQSEWSARWDVKKSA